MGPITPRRYAAAPKGATGGRPPDPLPSPFSRCGDGLVLKNPAGGMDRQAKRLEGKVFTVRFIDSAGQIHLEETGIALIPGIDEYEIVK
jgi:hypothetical protein